MNPAFPKEGWGINKEERGEISPHQRIGQACKVVKDPWVRYRIF